MPSWAKLSYVFTRSMNLACCSIPCLLTEQFVHTHKKRQEDDEMYKRLLLYGTAALIGILSAMAVTAVFTIMTVRGSGMEPAIYDGDRVLINKLAYAKPAAGDMPGEIPSVGDIVAFRSRVYGEEGEGSILVRRVAGSAGDTVEIKDSMFYLNDKPYDEYMKEPVYMEDLEKVKLGRDEIFLLGDNRTSSMDSRNEAIGVLKIDDCVGKVTLKWGFGRH